MPETDTTSEANTARSRVPSGGASSASSGNPDNSTPSRGWDAVVEHISSHRIDFILAVTRALTVLCTISYLIGFPGPASNRYKQALLMNAATSSLRLHQRMPPPPLGELGRNYLMSLILEDSFHYLIFPLMFFTGNPITLALLPCSLYAIFNLAVYTITMLEKLGDQDQLRTRICELIAKYQQSLLHTVALSEVALLPIVVIGLLTNTVGIFVPIFYYRFLMLRYNSTRNAHLKLVVSQIATIASAQAARFSSMIRR